MRGDEEVEFCDLVSGDKGMTVMVMLGGGPQSWLEIPFMLFQNQLSAYPIKGVPDSIPGVCYRPGPRGWMERRVFLDWLKDPRAVRKLQNDKKRVIFMVNASGHAVTDDVKDALSSINAEIRFLPRNAIDLC